MGKTRKLDIRWTIGVPFCPARRHWIAGLYEQLLEQIDGNKSIELLLIGDNYARCASYKHRLILDLAQGPWVSWVQDDAIVAPQYVKTIHEHLIELEENQKVRDIVTFPCGYRYETGVQEVLVHLDKFGGAGANPHGYGGNEACTPQFWHVWRREFIRPEWWDDDFNCDTKLFREANKAEPRLSHIESGILYTFDGTVKSTNQDTNPSNWRKKHRRKE